MKRLMIGAILSIAVACGIFVYTEWENKRFTDSLPKSPSVEQQTVDAHPHSHPHPHEHPHRQRTQILVRLNPKRLS